jgi:hypothetical protein
MDTMASQSSFRLVRRQRDFLQVIAVGAIAALRNRRCATAAAQPPLRACRS